MEARDSKKISHLMGALGFRDTEQQVVEYLVSHGPSVPGIIAKRTRIKRPTVYTALANLEFRGIVSKTVVNDKASYHLSDPEIFYQSLRILEEQNYESRRRALDDLKAEITSASRKRALKAEIVENDVMTVTLTQVYGMQYDALTSGDFCAVFDPAIVASSGHGKTVMQKFLSETSVSKPSIREILPKNDTGIWYQTCIQNPNHKIRFLPSDAVVPADIILSNGIISIIKYDNPEHGVRIRQVELYNSLQTWFEWLWLASA